MVMWLSPSPEREDTETLVKRCVESELDANYEQVVAVVDRRDEAVKYIAKHARDDLYRKGDERGKLPMDGLSSISALHLLSAVGGDDKFEEIISAHYDHAIPLSGS